MAGGLQRRRQQRITVVGKWISRTDITSAGALWWAPVRLSLIYNGTYSPSLHLPSPALCYPLSTHFPYHPRHTSIHPFHLTPPLHPFRRIPRPKIPPSSVGSATNYCIGNRLDYQSFDNASSSAASAPLRARSQHTLRVLSSRYHFTVFRAMANYLLRRSMNSNRNYISPDIQLELPVRSACLWGKRGTEECDWTDEEVCISRCTDTLAYPYRK